jgi:hypothetical protein
MNKKQIGIREFYKHYCETTKDTIDYQLYTKILKDFLMMLRNRVLSNESVKLPYKAGHLSIVKFEVKYDPDKQYKWKIDFKKTKELGYKVYYGSEYGYRWKWFKGRIAGKNYYCFKPCRGASRSITKMLNSGIDYYKFNNLEYK